MIVNEFKVFKIERFTAEKQMSQQTPGGPGKKKINLLYLCRNNSWGNSWFDKTDDN